MHTHPETPAPPFVAPTTDGSAAVRHKVRVLPSQRWFDAPAGETLLLAAERAGMALPSSCRNGTCRSCLCKIVQGRVVYAVEWPGLSMEEKAGGYVLPCVAIATTDIILEQPDATNLFAD